VGILGDGTFLYIITLTAGMAIFFVWIDYQFMTEWRKRVQPKQNRNDRRRPNQASEATSEHAPGAVSSARQG
jgi:hypothetical protein